MGLRSSRRWWHPTVSFSVSKIQALARASSALLHPADSPLCHSVTEVRCPGDSLIIFSLTQRPACPLLPSRATKFNSFNSSSIYQIHWFLSDPSLPPESKPLSLPAWMSAMFPSIQHSSRLHSRTPSIWPPQDSWGPHQKPSGGLPPLSGKGQKPLPWLSGPTWPGRPLWCQRPAGRTLPPRTLPQSPLPLPGALFPSTLLS